MVRVVDFPIVVTWEPEEAIAGMAKGRWPQVIGTGMTSKERFRVINTGMSAERALSLIEWGGRPAMRLEIGEQNMKGVLG